MHLDASTSNHRLVASTSIWSKVKTWAWPKCFLVQTKALFPSLVPCFLTECISEWSWWMSMIDLQSSSSMHATAQAWKVNCLWNWHEKVLMFSDLPLLKKAKPNIKWILPVMMMFWVFNPERNLHWCWLVMDVFITQVHTKKCLM